MSGTDDETPREERHPSMYLPDGDLVISAAFKPDSRTVQLFCVYRALLACHSPIFKDMLAIGEGTSNEIYDGVSRVHLPDDAEDVAGFLSALHNPATLPLERSDPDMTFKVWGTMKLETKYEVEMIRKLIIRHLENEWPCTFAEWERQQHKKCTGKVLISQTTIDYSYYQPERILIPINHMHYPEPASAIRFAMEFNCPAILPAAFYELARAVDVVEWDEADTETETEHVARPARWSSLKPCDFKRLIAGKSALLKAWSSTLASLQDYTMGACGRHYYQGRTDGDEPAILDCEGMLQRIMVDHLTLNLTPDPFEMLRKFVEALGPSPSHIVQDRRWCCSNGYSTCLEYATRAAYDLWDMLPKIFKLQDIMSTKSSSHKK